MDEGWGNIIYLIAMAIFIVYGAMKKKRPANISSPDKEDMADQLEQPSQESNTDFESILGTLLGQEVPRPYTQTENLDADIPSFEREVILNEDTKEDNKASTNIQDKKEEKRSAFDDLQKLYEQEQDEIEDEDEDVDWRQAIIYKEILDRKYE